MVGYNTKSVAANKNFIIGAQFEGVGQNATVSFDQLLKPNQVGAWEDGDDDLGNAPMIMANVNGAYEYYYYISNATDENDDEVGFDCWADSDGYILTDSEIQALGNGFWIRFKQTATTPDMNFAGQVDNGSTVSVTLKANDNKIVCNPFPTTLNLDNLSFADGITPGEWADGDDTLGNAPMIMAFVNGTYQYYYYISNAVDEDENDIGYDCWADSDGFILPTSKNPAIATGFWLRCAKAGKAVFTSPISAK